jgi:hypothetical protein
MGGYGLGLAAQQRRSAPHHTSNEAERAFDLGDQAWPNMDIGLGGIDRPSSETPLSVIPEFSADATSKTADLFEIMKLQRSLARPPPRVMDEDIHLIPEVHYPPAMPVWFLRTSLVDSKISATYLNH